MPLRETPIDLARDAWRILRNPLFWKVLALAVSIGTTAVSLGQRGWHWVALQRQALEGKIRTSREVERRLQTTLLELQTKVWRNEASIRTLEAQARLAGHEHVRFVAAVRHQNVLATLKIYDELVLHWPCSDSEGCLPPNRAVDVALAARVEP